ncbi:N-acetylmuramoyl-L-alanine amidase [Clostridium autoethanogenum]|uniref:N-acetylmuramoyl-L-alanine amidase n=1 Tax=Clostridium autoethanogenum DSM 10061 TaxID=1341692 RepID=A0ABM5NVD4_9CLOT|nr:N-acetylmuramoyl-L-alanine amidase [Clostridium autoethanogenum]AGY76502.1 N-acetylmuramoyl-L-alanine amidase [Clostridium autoethanogenum DSM 10061]ALU36663.1 Cell wall hydrolase/autolysin [Clostridium autoethanogenum DSM 10061]OVY50647.1 N-acetylmuramoyl-L-alanine amidase LytC precursor [Clostridium autoethanogenum]
MKITRISMMILLSLIFVLIVFAKGNTVHAINYSGITIGNDVETNKSWNIKFNMKLDQDTVNDSNIVVTDSTGNAVPISLQVEKDGMGVEVTPKSQYAYGKTYNLIVKSGVKAVNGKNLSSEAKVQFGVKSNPSSNNKYTVTIDAGHGGTDAGNISEAGLKEKDVDLSVALKTGKILEQNGVNVVYTRKDDNVTWNDSTNLQARFDIANNAKSNLFVSLHVNCYTGSALVNGIETYYRASNDSAKNTANNIQSDLISYTGLSNRGIKEGTAQHKILMGTTAPAVMVELGFMTNPKESQLIGSEDFQNKSASAIANGILKSLPSLQEENTVNVSSISNLSDSIIVGSKYSLPTSVQATMSDGTSKKVNIVWNPNNVDTSKVGIFTYKGTVTGYSKTVTFTLTVKAKQIEPVPVIPSEGAPVIVIDPGHGIGSDIGSNGNGFQEDDVTLSVGLKVGKILESKGVKVIYTRTTDERKTTSLTVTESLQRRCDTANNAGATYMISIHTNAFDDPAAEGTETLYYAGSVKGEKMAEAIQKSLSSALGTYSRGLKDGSWLYIAKHTTAPTVLTELGFLTNKNDAGILGTDGGRSKAAQAIASAILQVLGI